MKRHVLLPALFALALGVLVAPAATAGTFVYVVHALPGSDIGMAPALPLDISVNADCRLRNLQFGEVVGPRRLSPGTYELDLFHRSPDGPCMGDLFLSQTVTFEPDTAYAFVVHLTADGMPTATVFELDATGTGPGTTRIAMHNTAATGPVNFEFERGSQSMTLTGVANGEAQQTESRPGRWDLTVYDEDGLLYGPRSQCLQSAHRVLPLRGRHPRDRNVPVHLIQSRRFEERLALRHGEITAAVSPEGTQVSSPGRSVAPPRVPSGATGKALEGRR